MVVRSWDSFVFKTLVVVSFVASPLFADKTEEILEKAGIKPSEITQKVKEAVCKNPKVGTTFDGITLTGGAALSKGVFHFGGDAEFGLFLDRKHRRILGHIFIIPKAGISKPGAEAGVQIGAIFGRKGDPHNYIGYFASVSAFGLSLNLGVGNGIFERIGAYWAGIDLEASAPVKIQTAIADAMRTSHKISGIAQAYGDKSLSRAVLGGQNYQFKTVKNGNEVMDTIEDSLNEFEAFNQGNFTKVRKLLDQVEAYREYMARISKLPENERRIHAPVVEAEYLALEDSLAHHASQLARVSIMLRKYNPNKNLDAFLFGEDRFTKGSSGGVLGIGSTSYYQDEVTGERLSTDSYNYRRKELDKISRLIDLSNEQILALRNIRFVVNNDRANFTQGQSFKRNQSVGGIQTDKNILSGCNSISMNPKVFRESGGPLLMTMAEFSLKLKALEIQSLAGLKSNLLKPDELNKFGKVIKGAMHHADPSVSLSYYYTPEEIEKVFGVPVTDVTGKLEFELPVPDSLKDLLLGEEELCGNAHGASSPRASSH